MVVLLIRPLYRRPVRFSAAHGLTARRSGSAASAGSPSAYLPTALPPRSGCSRDGLHHAGTLTAFENQIRLLVANRIARRTILMNRMPFLPRRVSSHGRSRVDRRKNPPLILAARRPPDTWSSVLLRPADNWRCSAAQHPTRSNRTVQGPLLTLNVERNRLRWTGICAS